jgi:hypothetical protein
MSDLSVISIVGREAEYKSLCEVAGSQRGLMILPAELYREFDWDIVRLFMHTNALYCLPTIELLEFLTEKIAMRQAIEIGCGSGYIATNLGIPATDMRVQERPEARLLYRMSGQPLIEYPDHVETLEAMDAVEKYKPQVVIGSYITKPYDGKDGNMYAPDERDILKAVDTYIHIGDLDTHADKPLMKKKFECIEPDWLIVRGKRGFIGIWE